MNMELILQSFSGFMLVFCRITAFFVTAPVFSSRNVPTSFKIGFSVFVAFLTFSGLGLQPVPMDALYVLSIFKEILVGLLLGFIGYMFFAVIQTAGSFIDMQMGLSMANILDPMTGTSSPLIGNMKYMLAMLLFLSFNGHHLLLTAIHDSYNWIPLQNDVFARMYSDNMVDFMLRTFTDSFGLAFKMAAPLVVALFLTDVGLGILAKTAPQFNIFVIGVPMKIIIGLILLVFLFPGMLSIFEMVFTALFTAMEKFMTLLSGSP